MKIHTKIVIDILTYKVLEDEWYEYDGEVACCKGGSGGTTTKPLNLDPWMQSGPYAWLQDYFGQIQKEYPPMQMLQEYLGGQGDIQSQLQNELTGTGGSVAQQRDILGTMGTPEMMRASMSPYLNEAYNNIGQAGIPSSSYADKLISSAVTQGWLNNSNNLLSGWGNTGTQIGNLTDKLGTSQSNVYNMAAQPTEWIKALQGARYGQSISKSSSGGKSGGFLF